MEETHRDEPVYVMTESTLCGKPVSYVEVKWDTWSAIHDFVGEDFVKGVFIDVNTRQPLPTGETSHALGVIVNTRSGQQLACMHDVLIKLPDGSLHVWDKKLTGMLVGSKAVYGRRVVTDDTPTFPN